MNEPVNINLHSFLDCSEVNGPGRRAVVWFQGCNLACPGCFNPGTHPNQPQMVESVEKIVARIMLTKGIEGVTISGGEPFQQPEGLLRLLRVIRWYLPELSIVIFTGYALKEVFDILGDDRFYDFSGDCDVLIAGRYNQQTRIAYSLQASKSKTFHFFSERYAEKDFQGIPQAEIVISPTGVVTTTGINPQGVRLGA